MVECSSVLHYNCLRFCSPRRTEENKNRINYSTWVTMRNIWHRTAEKHSPLLGSLPTFAYRSSACKRIWRGLWKLVKRKSSFSLIIRALWNIIPSNIRKTNTRLLPPDQVRGWEVGLPDYPSAWNTSEDLVSPQTWLSVKSETERQPRSVDGSRAG